MFDGAIIGDTVWAVGEIYVGDTLYNAAMWDGRGWHILNIPYYYQNQAFYSPIYSVLAYSSSDIWFEAGIHWDGHQFNTLPLNIDFPSHANRMWGTSSSDFYIVGNTGLVAHKNGSTWTKIESGTTLDVQTFTVRKTVARVHWKYWQPPAIP